MTTIASDQRMRAISVCVGVEVTYPTATLRMEYCGHSARRLHTPSTTGLTKPFGQKAPSGFPNINTRWLRAGGSIAAPLSCPSKPHTFLKRCPEKKEKKARHEPEEEEEEEGRLSVSQERPGNVTK
jgi:hypothetical protein